MTHATLNEYLLWLAEDCKKTFDPDADLIEADIKVSDAVDLERKILLTMKDKAGDKATFITAHIEKMNAGLSLLQLAPGMVFNLWVDACVFRWVKDNVPDGAPVPLTA